MATQSSTDASSHALVLSCAQPASPPLACTWQMRLCDSRNPVANVCRVINVYDKENDRTGCVLSVGDVPCANVWELIKTHMHSTLTSTCDVTVRARAP
jgi:hypothetical protein